MMHYWLMKSEPEDVSIDDLAAMPGQTVAWYGVRNYQARNYMRDSMEIGQLAFFYHSGCAEPGIAGIVEICQRAFPDATQFDPASPYFDPKSDPANPRWVNVAVRFVEKTRLLSLREMKARPELAGMRLLMPGNRLSILPVDPAHWAFLMKLLKD